MDQLKQITALLAEADAIRYSDPHKVVLICEEAIELANLDSPHCQKELAQCLILHSASLSRLANYPAALNSASKALKIAESLDNKELIAGALVLKANMYCYQGLHPEALQDILKADKTLGYLNSENSNPARLAEILNRIGWIYWLMDESEKSLPYLQRALVIAREVGRVAPIANTLDSLGKAYLGIGDFDKAFTIAQESVDWARKADIVDILAACLLSVTSLHIHRAEYAQAIEYSQEVLAIAQSHGLRNTETRALRRLATVYQRQGDNGKALEYLHRALAVAREIGMKRAIHRCLQDLATLSKSSGDYAAALDYFEQFHAVRDEIFSEQANRRIKNLEIAHQVEQSQKENELNQQANAALQKVNTALQKEIIERKEAQVLLQKEIAERKEAQALAEKLAITDSLTGLLNRRHFFYMAEREIIQARRHKRPVALVMIDLDYFKNVNDTYGHPTGDAVLKMVASVIQDSIRTGDIVCRYGGEEFALLMPETDAIKSELVIKRIRKALSIQNVQTNLGSVSITFSAGIANFSAGESTAPVDLEMLIKRADEALYEAKHAGRDRTVMCLSN